MSAGAIGVRGRFARVPGTDLPIFRADGDRGGAVFYAPRLTIAVADADASAVEAEIALLAGVGERVAGAAATPAASTPAAAATPAAHTAALRLVDAARSALDAVSARNRAPFTPECLTLFLNNACALGCRYCHAAPGAEPDVPLSRETLAEAARLVTASCAAGGLPMTLALHGGGEPLLDRAEAVRVLGIVREEAARAGVRLRTYVATGGVLPTETARWAAREFDLIGLSCDGPPDIQDAQRPTRSGGVTSAVIERTAGIFRAEGARFHVRATITRETLDRQSEVVRFVAARLGPAEVRLEPVYANPGETAGLAAEDAERFVAGFMAARAAGAEAGVRVTTSLVRPDELYGPHCNVLRSVVNLAPGDIATGCFLESRASGIDRRGVRVGGRAARAAVAPGSGAASAAVPAPIVVSAAAFTLDDARIAALRVAATARPEPCADCICALQCTLGCPDVCVLEPDALVRHVGSFRCRAQRMLMEELVLDAAILTASAAAPLPGAGEARP